ncbi:MAG TPA: NAD-dependent deacylase [Actinomycetales bacterium]|nr:NAD-dependent deacylase [Actinomycetales bacterium]
MSKSTEHVPPAVLDLARRARRVAVLTGAGMSAESGVPTFRDAQTGLWERYDPMALATPEAWDEDPPLVWAWYAWRIRLLRDVEPNPGHRALAEWDARAGEVDLAVVTQNVDDLHERAGSRSAVHLHGSLGEFRCSRCHEPYRGDVEVPTQPVERLDPPSCERCGGPVRPGVVWFGEALPTGAFERAEQIVGGADLALVVGTSGLVYPAAGLPMIARARGVPVVEVNPGETDLSDAVHHVWRASAATALPALVAALTV